MRFIPDPSARLIVAASRYVRDGEPFLGNAAGTLL